MTKATQPVKTHIKMRATSAGPKGNHIAGSIYRVGTEVSADDAAELVSEHYAEYVEDPQSVTTFPRERTAEAAAAEQAEDAEERGGDETTAERPTKRGRKA